MRLIQYFVISVLRTLLHATLLSTVRGSEVQAVLALPVDHQGPRLPLLRNVATVGSSRHKIPQRTKDRKDPHRSARDCIRRKDPASLRDSNCERRDNDR